MKQNAMIMQLDQSRLAVMNGVMKQAGQSANKAAAQRTFERHMEDKAKNTERRKHAALELFGCFYNQ